MRPGKSFELAVFEFAKAVSEKAEVIFDYRCKDRDTGTWRQVDVWVNATILGHVPLSIAISCKDHRRPLDIGDIEKFNAEINSLGAHTGVIYASSGFCAPALAKAKALRIACCRLYTDEPAEVPQALLFHSYCGRSTISSPTIRHGSETVTQVDQIRSILNTEVESEAGPCTLLELIERAFHEGEKWSINHIDPERLFPPAWKTSLVLSCTEPPDLTIELGGCWRKYRGILEAHLLNGSYCFGSEKFCGSQAGPVIDTRGTHPGPGWEEISDEPLRRSITTVLALQYRPQVKLSLLEHLDKMMRSEKGPEAVLDSERAQ